MAALASTSATGVLPIQAWAVMGIRLVCVAVVVPRATVVGVAFSSGAMAPKPMAAGAAPSAMLMSFTPKAAGRASVDGGVGATTGAMSEATVAAGAAKKSRVLRVACALALASSGVAALALSLPGAAPESSPKAGRDAKAAPTVPLGVSAAALSWSVTIVFKAAPLGAATVVLVKALAKLWGAPATTEASVPKPSAAPGATAGVPNRACTAPSSSPCMRANWARLSISGSGASLVMMLSLLPRGTTCRPWPGASRAARCCRWAFKVWPLSTSAKSPWPAGAWAGAAAGLASVVGVEMPRLAKKLRFDSMKTSLW